MPAMPVADPAVTPEIRRYLPWLVAVALFMENLDATIVNTAVPTMATNLSVAPLSLKGVLTAYTLSLAVFIPISGWMADRFGTKRVFALAIGLFLAGSLFCGLATSVPLLVVARILQGMGGAMMTPVGRLALVRSFPRSEMLTTMNYVIIPALIGPLLGPFVGGLIVHWLHWRVIFFLNLPFALAGLWLVQRYMPDFRDADAPPLDRVGFLLFGTGIALLSYVLEVFGEHSMRLTDIGFMLAGAIALLAVYGWHAQRTAAPVLALSLFRVRTFRISVVGGFVTRLGIGGMPFLLPLLYQIGLGYAPWQAGLLTMPQAVAAIGMKVASKPLLARFGHRTVLMCNTVL
ncbi:MAG: MFS transporter, partial [Verrucomicrobia bacterium]|nr:MFS transporter [Verrucomicrobiota bacterium]